MGLQELLTKRKSRARTLVDLKVLVTDCVVEVLQTEPVVTSKDIVEAVRKVYSYKICEVEPKLCSGVHSNRNLREEQGVRNIKLKDACRLYHKYNGESGTEIKVNFSRSHNGDTVLYYLRQERLFDYLEEKLKFKRKVVEYNFELED